MQALNNCPGQLDDAALWLTQNATAHDSPVHFSNDPTSYHYQQMDAVGFKVVAVEIKTSCLSLCIIDDCRDSDVPLLELSFSQLNIRQAISEIGLLPTPTNSVKATPEHTGGSKQLRKYSNSSFRSGDGWLECTLAGYYYNRILSGWEPFIEPWM